MAFKLLLIGLMNQTPQFERQPCGGEPSWQRLEPACAWCTPTQHLPEPPLVGAAGLPITHVLCDNCSARLMREVHRPRNVAA